MDSEEKNKNTGILKINATGYITRLSPKFLGRKLYERVDPGMIRSFMPGTVLEVLVSEGQEVARGQELLVLDSMKMKNRILCKNGGVVESIEVESGQKVAKGSLLIKLRK